MADLQRFLTAQQSIWPQARDELLAGRKRSHWMWFIFPQLAGLGRSSTAQFYGIHGIDEARSYLAHPVLGARLLEATRIVAACPAPSAEHLMGGIDAVKLRSSMTLFGVAEPEQACFFEVLERYFGGRRDELTLQLLAA